MKHDPLDYSASRCLQPSPIHWRLPLQSFSRLYAGLPPPIPLALRSDEQTHRPAPGGSNISRLGVVSMGAETEAARSS